MGDANHQELMDLLRTLLKIQSLSAVRDLPTKKEKILFLSDARLVRKGNLADRWFVERLSAARPFMMQRRRARRRFQMSKETDDLVSELRSLKLLIILQLLRQGVRQGQIAAMLGVSEPTMSRCFRKASPRA